MSAPGHPTASAPCPDAVWWQLCASSFFSASLMFVGAGAQTIGVAIGAISLSVGLLFSTESSYWSTAIDVAQHDAGAASGLMNLAGNLGGILSASLVPLLVLHFSWFYALVSGSAFAILAGISWFFIQPGVATGPDRTLEKTSTAQLLEREHR